jgi:hypothetical protein
MYCLRFEMYAFLGIQLPKRFTFQNGGSIVLTDVV